MENILLFVATIFVYSSIWFLIDSARIGCWTILIKRIAIIALIALPFNIDGNVYTIAGNAITYEDGKGVFSIFSLYQRAEKDAVLLFGLGGYQRAKNEAITAFGFTSYQEAGLNAGIGIGLAFYQRVGEKTRSFGAFFSALRKD